MASIKLNPKITKAVIRVGEGRGFVVKAKWGRPLVITAAHCLPYMPPASSGIYWEEKTYKRLLGPLAEDATVWTECLFVNPVADIAVLTSPNDQDLSTEAYKYDSLTGGSALRIAKATEKSQGWLLDLDNQWQSCTVHHHGGSLSIENATGMGIRGGMSGSPIINDRGRAIGVVTSANKEARMSPGSPSDMDDGCTQGFPNPNLMYDLPGGILENLTNKKGSRGIPYLRG